MDWLKKLMGRSAEKKGVTADGTEPIMSVEIPAPDRPATLYQDQILRKAWAEDVLTSQSIPINKHLPCIEGEAEVTVRSAQEIERRLLALTIIAMKGEGAEQSQWQAMMDQRGGRALFSPDELSFIDDADASVRTCAQFSWRYESAWVMLWALKHVHGPMDMPTDMCNVVRLLKTVMETQDLKANGVQSANNILNEADLIYRYHWATREAGLRRKPAPGNLSPDVIMERHQALNWLIQYGDGADWDDVGTDT
jgi:hypothetical protein